MNARDIMTREVVSVRADTPTRDIARLLLENHISAVPVLDATDAPIGMVSEGDLIGRDEAQREARREWWLAMLAEGEELNADFLTSLQRPAQRARDVMAKPVITVTEDTDASEVARVLQAHRIKRVPVLHDGRLVGIVSRENLLRVLAQEQPRESVKAIPNVFAGVFAGIDRHFEHLRHQAAPPGAPMPQPKEDNLSVADFRRLVADHESREAQHQSELRRSAAEQRRRQVAELVDRHISDEGWGNLLHQARLAAEHGAKEFLLLRFPSQLCSDGGRAINVAEPDWPATLRGEAAELYLRWDRALRPQGFHLAARVLDFPEGKPGDVGLFLVWGT